MRGLAAGRADGLGRSARESTTPPRPQRTYARLAEIAATALRNGFDAIVDATFLRRSERGQFRALADQAGARFAILDCAAPESVLREPHRARARPRARDASEAGLAVLDRQLADREPLGDDEQRYAVRVATDRELDVDARAGGPREPLTAGARSTSEAWQRCTRRAVS